MVGKFAASDILSRLMAIKNIASGDVVMVIGPEFIDDWEIKDYQKFDALFLYSYDYHKHTRAWSTIEAYVKEGGRVFIDTGGDVKESASLDLPAKFPQNLPALFPIDQTDKDTFGTKWQLKPGDSELGQEAKISNFKPLLLDGEEWGISYAEPDGLREEAKAILFNQDKVVMAEMDFGKGKVIWSGMNLPYHVAYYKEPSEMDLFVTILSQLVDINKKPKPTVETEWIKPEKRKIILPSGGKGALIKEYYVNGWGARLEANGDKRRVTIYPAGPAYSGYMYVPVPTEYRNSEVEVEFKFSGRFIDWIYELLPLFGVLIIVDSYILKGRLLARPFGFLSRLLSGKMSHWWEKDEDY